eukprot:gnl/MRDRNA2_/MRDRNA2_149427_c0_seq1.p1 gnl/MRDRNA2_/MRDRNA2_149427_c0~~gnl/MRDRNA2_/MRDRNA2_149427_c0_seq1.p1  ORF type:complete len:755 (+),score=101.22 gnl/MRDRNA2_/MRDRNA2_149427_c0_seq1:233-2266(+)
MTAWFYFTTVFFALDIGLNCITGFFEKGILIMRQSWILRKYSQRFFIIDLVSTFPWELVITDDAGSSSHWKLVRSAKMARLLRLAKLAKLAERFEEFLPSVALQAQFHLLKMLVFFSLLIHWSACVWAFIGSPLNVGLTYDEELDACADGESSLDGSCERGVLGSPWIRRFDLQDLPTQDLYLMALQFAVAVITSGEASVGPGYIWELVYCVILMVISFLVCSVILSELVVICSKMNEDHREFRESLRAMREFMNSRQVPITLQGKIQRYLEFQHEKALSGQGDCEELLHGLSPSLGLELMESLHGETLMRHPFFLQLPPRVFRRACAVARNVLYAPGDIVVQKGHRAAAMCFILRGRVRIVANKKGRRRRKEASRNKWGVFGSSNPELGDVNSSCSLTSVPQSDMDIGGSAQLSTIESSPSMGRIHSGASAASSCISGAESCASGLSRISAVSKQSEIYSAPKKQAEDLELESPSWIGDLCLFKEMVRANTVIALTHAELLTVTKDSIVSLVREFPKLQPLYEAWQKRVIEEDVNDEIGLRCEHCLGLGHSLIHCPKLKEQLKEAVPTSTWNAGKFAKHRQLERNLSENTRKNQARSQPMVPMRRSVKQVNKRISQKARRTLDRARESVKYIIKFPWQQRNNLAVPSGPYGPSKTRKSDKKKSSREKKGTQDIKKR